MIRVLVVDDNVLICRAVAHLLRSFAEVVTVSNAEQALDQLETGHYDAILTDFHMPDMCGLALLEEVRERWPKVRRFLMSGSAEVDLSSTLFESFLPKPFMANELRQMLAASATSA